ncbi:MAG: hypothetical protein CMN56_05260 [Sneathiella sp.]|uniref:hypothetical protein n=1 Tax=Sneathiella sp. TaxID=1964365 RepID=UPI000C4EC97A|nr:hypothetical protein [Sneathiella sp.]MAZ02528.1 hypothetical protein [Sneathiella sp.]
MRVLLLFLLLTGCATAAPDSALRWHQLDTPLIIGEGEKIRYMAGRNDTKTFYLRYEISPSAAGYENLPQLSHETVSEMFKTNFAPVMCSTSPYKDKMKEGYSYDFLIHKENQFKYTIGRFEVAESDCL